MSGLRVLVASFREPDRAAQAIEALPQAGARAIDAFGPYPSEAIARALGVPRSRLPWLALAAIVLGGGLQYVAQTWLNAVDYPINVGGRPLHAWPAFVPATIVVSFLWGSAAVFAGMIIGSGLTRLHHPVFELPDIERATQDRFLVLVRPRGDRVDETKALLARFDAEVREATWPD